MLKFIDEKKITYLALAEAHYSHKVNGEKSLQGVIYTNSDVLKSIDRGWSVELENEKYFITYATPVDNGENITVEFDAIHEFFFDFGKSSIYEELSGDHSLAEYLNFIFNGSGYSYTLDAQADSFEKSNFGMKNRLSLFNDVINTTNTEFEIVGKNVRITDQLGEDLSSIVKKGFNMQELGLEHNIAGFITYAKGFGAFNDENDESKGRLVAEYKSPFADVYGILEGDPLVDEKCGDKSELESRLEALVCNSYTISVSLTLEDLQKAGYEYALPKPGDYILAINENLGFSSKIRIISVDQEYDVHQNIYDYKVTCSSESLIEEQQKADVATANTWREIQNGNKRIPNDWLTDAVNVATEALLNAQTEIKFTKTGILAIDKKNANNLVLFNSAGIGISSNGGKTFENAITAKGINASVIKTGTLEASLLKLSWNTISNSIQFTGDAIETYENGSKTLGINGAGMYVYYPNKSEPLFSLTRAGSQNNPFGILGIRKGQPFDISRKTSKGETEQTYSSMLSFDPDANTINVNSQLILNQMRPDKNYKGINFHGMTLSGNAGIALVNEDGNAGIWFGDNGDMAHLINGIWKSVN